MNSNEQQFIKKVTVNLFNSTFMQDVSLDKHLNIISGINGTGKTKFLELIKTSPNGIVKSNDSGDIRIIAFSPKRNSIKKSIENITNEISSQNKKLKTQVQNIINSALNDNTFVEYPTFSEMFLLHYKEIDNDPKLTHEKAMKTTENNFNNVLNEIFPSYRIKAGWNENTNGPEIKIYKKEFDGYIDAHDVSTGEQEVLSLVFNIYNAKDDIDVILIDEPEIHLNWTLEFGEFNFFKSFAKKYNKQIIITTHSRIILLDTFKKFVKYFTWENKKIVVKDNIPQEYQNAIVGEAIKFIESVKDNNKKTLIVEDKAHEHFVNELLKLFKKNSDCIQIIKMNDSKGALNNLYKALKNNDNVNDLTIKTYFLIDGDNDDIYSSDSYYIKLNKYSIESYLFSNINILASVLGKKTPQFKKDILCELKKLRLSNKNKYNKSMQVLLKNTNNKIFLTNFFDVFDCSGLAKDLCLVKQGIIHKYIQKLGKENVNKLFDKKLIDFIKSVENK